MGTPVKGNIPYSSWSRGEPNNSGGNEDCTMQHGSKKWNDLNCNSQQPYICQFKAVIPAPPPRAPPAPKIPGGYKKGGDGYYYKFHGDRKNWNDAQRTCKSEGGNLAIIWNQKTRDVVHGFMKDGWIGVSDQWQEGRWQTPVKGNIPYSSWNRGEPNNAGNEDCTMQHDSKKWNDLNCNSQQPYICQFKAGVGKRENEEFSEDVAEMEREEEDLDEEVVEMEKEEADLDETLVQMEKEVDEEIVEKVREEEDFDEAVEEVEREEADLSEEILGVKKEAADLSEEVVELKKEAADVNEEVVEVKKEEVDLNDKVEK